MEIKNLSTENYSVTATVNGDKGFFSIMSDVKSKKTRLLFNESDVEDFIGSTDKKMLNFIKQETIDNMVLNLF